MNWTQRSFLTLPFLLLLVACQAREGGAPAEGVTNEALDLVVSSVPAPFVLQESTPQAIRFGVAGQPGEAVLTVVFPPAEGGVNLIEITEQKLAWFEQQPEGISFGSQELVAPFGSAYTARGRYRGGSGMVEEIWTFGFHLPTDGILQIVYRYPAGEDSAERAQQLLALIGEIGFGVNGEGG